MIDAKKNPPKPLPSVAEGQKRKWYVCTAHNSQAYVDYDAGAQPPSTGKLACGCDISARHVVKSDEPASGDGSRGYDYYEDLGTGRAPSDDGAKLPDYYRDRLTPDAQTEGHEK